MIYLNQNVDSSAKFRERQTAYVVTAESLQNGRYEKSPGEFEPNYVILQDGRKVSRINIIAAVVSITEDPTFKSFIIDDGTAKMSARIFDKELFQDIQIGDLILLIGRPREFGSEIYLVPEIMKKIQDPKWVEHRKVLLSKISPIKTTTNITQTQEENFEETEVIEIVNTQTDNANTLTNKPPEIKQDQESKDLTEEDIIEKIRKLDKGEGVFIEDLTKLSENSEKQVKNLLEQGEIFEIKPGRVKVLE